MNRLRRNTEQVSIPNFTAFCPQTQHSNDGSFQRNSLLNFTQVTPIGPSPLQRDHAAVEYTEAVQVNVLNNSSPQCKCSWAVARPTFVALMEFVSNSQDLNDDSDTN